MNPQQDRRLADIAEGMKSEAVQALVQVAADYSLQFTLTENEMIIQLPHYLADDGVVGEIQVPVEEDNASQQ